MSKIEKVYLLMIIYPSSMYQHILACLLQRLSKLEREILFQENQHEVLEH